MKQHRQFDFGDGWEPVCDFVLFEDIIQDRGSRYSVSVGRVRGRDDIKSFLARLKSSKRYATADHNSWAVRISYDGAIHETKRDDGEKGAGQVILRAMQTHRVTNCIVCVTRWFGGVKLMGDRFRHVQDAAHHALKMSSPGDDIDTF